MDGQDFVDGRAKLISAQHLQIQGNFRAANGDSTCSVARAEAPTPMEPDTVPHAAGRSANSNPGHPRRPFRPHPSRSARFTHRPKQLLSLRLRHSRQYSLPGSSRRARDGELPTPAWSAARPSVTRTSSASGAVRPAARSWIPMRKRRASSSRAQRSGTHPTHGCITGPRTALGRAARFRPRLQADGTGVRSGSRCFGESVTERIKR